MARKEIEELLNRFGFTQTLNQRVGGLNIRHVMQYKVPVKRLVEYYLDEVLDTVKAVWVFNGDVLDCIENVSDLANWLGQE